MSEAKRRILYVVLPGLPEAQKPKVAPDDHVKVFTLTEANAAEALEKIFAADAISVWGEL